MQIIAYGMRLCTNASFTKTLRIMRITAFFLLMGALQLSATTRSQTITFQGKGNVLRNAFYSIEKQTGYTVLYSKQAMEQAVPFEMNVRNMPLEKFLDSILHFQPLKYMIENKSILIVAKPSEVPAFKLFPQVQLEKITGVVTDTTGNPLAGATVVLKGTPKNTFTDERGRFSIEAEPGDILVISFVGYMRREVKAVSGQLMQVSLKRFNGSMDEVAVINTGYQRLSQRELASAVVQVKMKDVQLDSRLSIDQMLTGVIPGLMSLQTSGEPGATPTLRIRGVSSIMGGSAPLWVLDGIILEDPVNVDLSNLNSPDAKYLIGNAIAGVNARDVESITVLKDASATAIYGSRAANGVIVVTTKKGRSGRPQVNYSGSLSVNTRPSYGDFNLMNAGERMQLSKEIIESRTEFSRVPRRLGYEGLYLDYLDKKLSYEEFTAALKKMSDRNTDWYDLLFRNSLGNNQFVNLSGGSDRTTYYFSLGYSDLQGAAKGSSQKRYNTTMKLQSWLHEKLFVGVQVNASKSDGRGFFSRVNPNQYAYETARTIPAFNDDGSYHFYLTQQKSQEFPISVAPKEDMLFNILNEMNLTGAKSDIASITAQMNIEYKILKNLRYRFLGGYDYSSSNSTDWAEERSNFVATKRRWNAGYLVPGTVEFDDSVIPWGGILSNSDQRKGSYTLRNSFEFNQLLAQDHLVNAMVAQELRSLRYKGVAQTWYGWQPERGNTVSPAITKAYTGLLPSLNPTISDNINNNLSWIGSLAYTYKNKFTFNANIRADGSNNFGTNPKYRFLPVWSVAGKYTISQEPFLLNSPLISYLAVRGSYGIQGNIDKATSPNLIIRIGSRNGVTGLNESFFKYLSNPDLRWEKTTAVNLGLEFGISGKRAGRLNDLLSGTLDIYRKDGENIIVSRRVSQVIGLDQVKVNGGRVRNTGIEGNLQFVPLETKDLTVTFRVNASYNKNVLVEANKDLGITNQDKLGGSALIEGEAIGSFYSYPYAGLNENSGFPMFYNSKGERRYELYVDETQLVYSGNRLPELSGGFGLNIRYKAWQIGANFQYAKGGVDRLPNFYRVNYYDVFDALANTSKELKSRWRKPGDEKNTNIPVLYDNETYLAANKALNLTVPLSSSYKTPLEMYDLSDLRTAPTDNIRLRNINVNYIVQPPVLKRLGMQSLILNFQAENIFLFANDAWLGRDPESGGSNTPLPKVFSFTISAGF